jgi:hypothetical protein
MNKFAFAAVAALALTAATSAFADPQVVQLGHGATIVVGANQASGSTGNAGNLAEDQVIQTGHGAAVLARADRASSPAGDLAGLGQVIQTGHGATVALAAGPAVVSNGTTQLVRNNDVDQAKALASLGTPRDTNG